MTRPLIAASVVTLCACAGGTETGNPAVPITLELSVRSSDVSAVVVRSPGDATRIDEAWVAFGEPLFLPEGQCGQLDEYPVGATRAMADLAAADLHLEFEVEAMPYCGLVAPLQGSTPSTALPEGAPPELRTSSLVLRGSRADGTPFLLVHGEQDELEVVAERRAIELTEGGPRLLLAFDLAALMRGVDLEGAEVGPGGAIRIDRVRNAALHQAFDRNLECSLELFLDSDGDRGLDARDDTRVARCAPQ